MSREKIFTTDCLSNLKISLESKGSVVHAHGVFDLLHVGHISHLSQAKELGDCLVVSITPDEYVNKGPNRPAFTEQLRAEALASLEVVDFVIINNKATSENIIYEIKPNIYVKGTEFKDLEDITNAVSRESDAVKNVGGRIEFVGDIVFSSSTLLNQYMSSHSVEQEDFLDRIRSNYSLDEVLQWLEAPKHDTVAIISETILDEYLFTSPLGQSSKDPILAVNSERLEICAGGGLAIANHLSGFCKEVHLLSRIGNSTQDRNLVQGVLNDNVTPIFFVRGDSPTIRKRRIVDEYSGIKLIEVYEMDSSKNSDVEDNEIIKAFENISSDHQLGLTVIADYGHGLISPIVAEKISTSGGFFALNSQCNAGNQGMNSFRKYVMANYLCMAEKELRMEFRDYAIDFAKSLKELATELQADHAMLTQGKKGTMILSAGGELLRSPSLTNNVVDRVGAGDSVFAITSLLLKHNAPLDIVNLMANAAGAIQVSELGNRQCLDRARLSRFITSLLK